MGSRASPDEAAAPAGVVAVAYSGGRDSTALLHATLAAAAELGLRVLALHVHHGLHPQADAWLQHCERQCGLWRRRGRPVEFAHRRLALQPAPGESVEAVARTARYRALREMALEGGAGVVMLAHHRRDQAETFLLQALRGAGPAGLSAMPRAVQREGLWWLRPWLGRPREALESYVRRHRLRHVDDDSNADPRHARNRLRLSVWPALVAAFPQAEVTLADAAAWAQDARHCLDTLAQIDLATLDDGEGLDVAAWRRLPMPRARNVLRAWLHACGGRPPAASLLQRLGAELGQARVARWPAGGGELRLYRERLRWVAPAAPAVSGPPPAPAREAHLRIARAGAYRLPGWGGVLRVRRARSGGVPMAVLAQLDLQPRVGGERFQGAPDRPARSLKKQFQAQAVPDWERQGPLVWSQGRLVYVPGLGVDARVMEVPGRSQWVLHWERDSLAHP